MATKTNIEVKGHKYFRITRTVGHRFEDGKKVPIKKQFLGRSKGEAEKKYKEYIQEQARIKYEGERIRDTATLHYRATEYIENVLSVSTKYAQATKDLYAGAYRNHIQGTWIDKMLVKDIKAASVQKFYNSLDVSESTLKRVNKFMSALYKWMVLNEYAVNVLPGVELPKKKDTRRHDEIVVWDDETLHRLVSQRFDFRADFMIKLMSYTGMRISECLALKYTDIWDDVIHVSRQCYRGEIKEPKYNSKRDIPLHKELSSALEIHKAWHQQEMIDHDYQTDYIFTTPLGHLYDAKNLKTAFERFYKREGIEYKNFHVYRATFCTNLCRAGVPLEVTSKLMGHKSLEVTAAHYALIHKETKEDAIARLKL